MPRQLNEDISFCTLDGRLVFLDIQRDCYFQLSDTLERTFLNHLETFEAPATDPDRFAMYGLLPCTPGAPDMMIEDADQSVAETPAPDARVHLDDIRQVFANVMTVRWQLRTRRFRDVLREMSTYREHRTAPIADERCNAMQMLVEAARIFTRLRPYVPIRTSCLLDSISMIRFLSGRGLHAHLVMGVACDPFSAHAWVQSGPLLLNETVGTAQTHIPIRII